MATTQPLTQKKAIEYWTEYQRLISVGAYSERSAEHYETNTWPEDGVEEAVANLETWAEKQGLEFCYNHDSKTWGLQAIEEPPDLVKEMHDRIDSPGYNELGEDEPMYVHPEDREGSEV